MIISVVLFLIFFFLAEDSVREWIWARGEGDVYEEEERKRERGREREREGDREKEREMLHGGRLELCLGPLPVFPFISHSNARKRDNFCISPFIFLLKCTKKGAISAFFD